MAVNKNEEYIVNIVGEGYEGEGVARIDNFPVFIHGALLNEKVKIKIVKVNKNFGFGKIIEIIEASENRANPFCKSYKTCGGCNLQHYNYEAQLSFKTNRVKDCMKKIGKLNDVLVHDCLGMEEPFRYRNKVMLPVGGNLEKINIGFYSPRSHDINDIDICHIQHLEGDKTIEVVKSWMKKNNIEPYNETKHSGLVKHIMVRKGFKTKEVMIVIVTTENKFPKKEELINDLRENIEGLVSIVQNINSKKTNVVLGLENITLWGKDTIEDYIGEFKFKISPLSFFQVNPHQTEVLYNKALEYAALTGDETVFDAYCGTGTISLFLSKKAKKVYGVEIIPAAIENAIENAKTNNIENAEFFVGKCEEVIPELIQKGIKADVVMVDPPRKGCEKSLLEALVKMEPEKIVYVSCDPTTLARDLAILEELDYKTIEVQPVDMFPHTAHVETCVLLQRKTI
ncbi:23S rRNA m(5)U-1939 methyltransferase [Clostridium cavendishii DSM 21758]|uniref:23S rRNA m(5)U-1939 methyltransferase n=1 Tax=Clostridium cavendishii DSM 21758 TaxID=1121302 RepID=A0A1M6SBI6_9CLOT|nr:23S rRNA (uracil(1939)-C(5))-methyltransferase RlmD [Clostridium cavendishii]SHK41989.1 23S rRNA m(5)U-1939 methyltransferase [Clostridium cavendishii DSM 21758]